MKKIFWLPKSWVLDLQMIITVIEHMFQIFLLTGTHKQTKTIYIGVIKSTIICDAKLKNPEKDPCWVFNLP